MSNNYIPLDSDDVILLDDDAFKVSKFKQLVELQVQEHLNKQIYEEISLEPGVSILKNLSMVSLNKHQINLAELNYHYVTKCQVLKVASPAWQKGKLSITVFISHAHPHTNQTDIIFFPEENNDYDAILEDIFKIVSEN